ncbi:MAG: alpha-amylase family protein, partial [Demequina sp.]
MTASHMADLWWKNATFYCLDVETYQDSNGDGIGDFVGLTNRIEHLSRLGVTCLWLMPFYESPGRDDGYDISDYYQVDPRLGTLGDFVEMVRTARSHGIHVIADLVVNHTSDQHPWFKESRSSKTNPKRDWYVWRDEPPKDDDKEIFFPDEEDSVWERDGRTRQYFMHRFYKHQPDLNITNPEVREQISRIMGFWMELGLSGFRVDAVPYLIETGDELHDPDVPDAHDYLRSLASFMARRRGDAIMLGETNLPYDEVMRYFGDDGPELMLSFDFLAMQSMFLSLAREDATALRDMLASRPAPPREAQWANFVRNHDELTLDKLSEDEVQEVFDAFGSDPDMQLWGRGLRRRLPSMLGGDDDRIRMVYSLLFSMPGAPVLFYGEEIGMVENLDVPGRKSVRTPMQWGPGETGGFTTGSADDMPLPMPSGPLGPQHVNVAAQRDDPSSLLTFMQMLVHRRRETPHFGLGESRWLDTGHEAVLAQAASLNGSVVLAVHNLGT